MAFFLASMPIAGGMLARSRPDAPAWQSDWWLVLIYVLPGICVSLVLWATMTWPSVWEGSARYAAVLLMALGPFLAAIRIWGLRRLMQKRKTALSEWATLAWNAVVQTALSGYLVITAIQIVVPESLTVGDLNTTLVLWTVYASVVIVLAVRLKSVEMIRVMLVMALVVATILLVATGGMASISKAMLKKAGWGNYPAKLFVTDRGCDILNRSSGYVVCKPEKAAGGNLVCPVIVRSRIGTPNFFFVSPFTPSGNWPDREKALNVSLPKEDVIVSQRIAELTKSSQPIGTRDTQGPATHLVSQSGEQGRWMMNQCGNIPAMILRKE